MESDESMKLIRTVSGFYYTDDENLDYITTQECYSSDALPDTLLVIDRAKSSLKAHSGLFLLYKTSDNIDFKTLFRLHEEYSAVQRTNRRGTVYLASLKISLDPFLMTDTRQQYLEQITHYFAAFREIFAKAFNEQHPSTDPAHQCLECSRMVCGSCYNQALNAGMDICPFCHGNFKKVQ